MIDMISMQVQWLPPGSIVKICKGSLIIKSKFCIMKNKQEIDCIFRKVCSFKKYVKCKRRDRVKAKMKPCITAHMTAFSLLLSFGKWAFFCLPTDCLHFCTRSFLPDPCFFCWSCWPLSFCVKVQKSSPTDDLRSHLCYKFFAVFSYDSATQIFTYERKL